VVVILAASSFYSLSNPQPPPSLDVYSLKGEVLKLRSFFFPDFAVGNLLKQTTSSATRVHVRRMDVQFSPVVAICGERPPPFVPDLDRRFCNIRMTVKFEGDKLFNFVIPLQSITNALPTNSVDFQDPLPCSEDLTWGQWTQSGVGLATLGSHGPNESLASQLLQGYMIGLQGGCLFTYQYQGIEQELTSYDYSFYAVQRERFRLNEPHPEVEVDILEPDPHDLQRMKLVFGRTNNVVLPCVRRRRCYPNLQDRVRAAMDEEHIVLFERVRGFHSKQVSLYLTEG
jgi:hypothetical protein